MSNLGTSPITPQEQEKLSQDNEGTQMQEPPTLTRSQGSNRESIVKAINKALRANKPREAIGLINKAEAEGYPAQLIESLKNLVPIRHETSNSSRWYSAKHQSDTRNIGTINSTPLVSVIVVSHNSRKDLKETIESIQRQSYKKWELILIDNGTDEPGELVKSIDPKAKIIKSQNRGFADANNLGLEYAEGGLILLLNPDARLEKDSIKNMVHALRLDSSAAAVCPKIYFYEPFLKISIKNRSRKRFAINQAHLQSQLFYPKIFLLSGKLVNDRILSSNDGEILLELSAPETQEQLEFSLELSEENKGKSSIEFQWIGSSSKPTVLQATGYDNQTISIPITPDDHSSSRHLINNAGSGLRDCGSPYDIGFGEEDHGQFNSKSYVQALCGCCVLLRRDLFIKRKIFISEFFAYYEDSELSHWIRSNGLKILFNPSSIVYHKHSTSTEEKSALWTLLVRRSKSIYDSITSDPSQIIGPVPEATNKLKDGLPKKYDSLLEILQEYDNTLATSSGEQLAIKDCSAVGIYNSYWNTMGGGEKHALDFAVKALAKSQCQVFLLSEHDFEIEDLEAKFGLSLAGAKKIVSGDVTPSLTERFDLFINSTYLSSLESKAFISYYIVSFPQKKLAEHLKNCYVFLHNSHFTSYWAHRYWGAHSSRIVLPIQSLNPSVACANASAHANSAKIMLSVGRFNYAGHCKNQHQIIKAYIRAAIIRAEIKEWKLVLIGGCNTGEASSVEHLRDCIDLAKGHNIDLFANVSRRDIVDLYKQSDIYIHAAGLGIDPTKHPEKCEHFGIAVFEALAHGCLPIVHQSAGPYEQCANLPNAQFFDSDDELVDAIIKASIVIESGDLAVLRRQSIERSKSLYNNSRVGSNLLFQGI